MLNWTAVSLPVPDFEKFVVKVGEKGSVIIRLPSDEGFWEHLYGENHQDEGGPAPSLPTIGQPWNPIQKEHVAWCRDGF